MIVALDGPAGSGKSTTARAVADRLGFLYLDTGAMYRAVGLAFAQADYAGTEAEAQQLLPTLTIGMVPAATGVQVTLNGADVSEAIRTQEAGIMASKVAKLPSVREKMVAEQRRLAQASVAAGQGVVLEGRDIGTVVFPQADLKVFMVADPWVRAQRRHAQLAAQGKTASVEAIHAEIVSRDQQDRERAVSPLRRADDAVALDTTHLSLNAQVAQVVAWVQARQAEHQV